MTPTITKFVIHFKGSIYRERELAVTQSSGHPSSPPKARNSYTFLFSLLLQSLLDSRVVLKMKTQKFAT